MNLMPAPPAMPGRMAGRSQTAPVPCSSTADQQAGSAMPLTAAATRKPDPRTSSSATDNPGDTSAMRANLFYPNSSSALELAGYDLVMQFPSWFFIAHGACHKLSNCCPGDRGRLSDNAGSCRRGNLLSGRATDRRGRPRGVAKSDAGPCVGRR